ncbi:hypothetical protein C0J52_19832 [Blattella germanica]|nr:hypothetical protein C0J52_19832 [Blattella germanica]
MSSESSDDLYNELISALDNYLQDRNIDEALTTIHLYKYEECIKDRTWDIIPSIYKFLNQETIGTAPDVFECCKKLLEVIAYKADPEDALLGFLEQAETSEDDIKFLSLLRPLEISLSRLPKRRGQSLEWCLSMIYSHVSSLHLPENYRLEGSERKLMDSNPSVIRIIDVYKEIVPFYKLFIDELSKRNVMSSSSHKTDIQRDMLVCYSLQLLGRPLAVLDLQINDGTCSAMVPIVEELISSLTGIVGDLMIFLEYTALREVEVRSKKIKNKRSLDNNDEEAANIFVREDKLPTLSIAVLYYLVLAEQICLDKIPQVYSPVYIFQRCLFLIDILLRCSEEFIIHKGLLLAKAVISRLEDGSIHFSSLDSPLHKEFIESLTKVMVYSEVEEQRKSGVIILKKYLHKFDVKGQYLLMTNLPTVVNHSGILGFLITQLKDMIIQSSNSSSYFCGKSLFDLLKKYCSLQYGAETDLVENADQVISALNLLRFLILRDKDNKTGIWDNIGIFQNIFLDPLREGIKLSRAHYELKLKDLEEEKKNCSDSGKTSSKSEVTIIVGGQQLPNLPYEEKVAVINSALNAFDLMESLFSRVNECIECGQSCMKIP